MAGTVEGAALARAARARQIVCDCGTPVCFGCEYCHVQGCEDYLPPGVFDKCTHHLGGFEDPDELGDAPAGALNDAQSLAEKTSWHYAPLNKMALSHTRPRALAA